MAIEDEVQGALPIVPGVVQAPEQRLVSLVQLEPLKFSAGTERLDPGQETTESLDVDFPAAALKAGTLKSIRLNVRAARGRLLSADGRVDLRRPLDASLPLTIE
jgi:hypothetical protein